LDPSSASYGILKRELELEGILLSIGAAGLITCQVYELVRVFGTGVEMHGDRGVWSE
jgi:hypothetical protein